MFLREKIHLILYNMLANRDYDEPTEPMLIVLLQTFMNLTKEEFIKARAEQEKK